MREEVTAALTALVERLTTLALQDAQVRAQMRRLASSFLSAIEEDSPGPSEVSAPQTEVEVTSSASPPVSSVVEPRPRLIVGPTLIDRPAGSAPTSLGFSTRIATREEPAAPASRKEIDDADLPLIAARCRLKAEGAQWAATRRQRIAAHADYEVEIAPRDRDIIERARQIEGCFLWMNHPSGPSPSDLSLFDDVAGCFDVTASAVELVHSLLSEADVQSVSFEKALDLLAEAQSALRTSIENLDGSPDSDQNKIHLWLKSTASKRQIFIERYMRVDDAADPTMWADIGDRVQAVDSRLQEARQRDKRSQQEFGRIRYHLGQLSRGDGDAEHHWKTIVQSVAELVTVGVPPSNAALRELLIPMIDDLPEMTFPPEFERVLVEIDRFLATRPTSHDVEAAVEASAEVEKVAELLAGRTMVLIGGERRPHAYEAIKRAFRLKELDWIATLAHESIETFDPHVSRDDVAVVLLAIRWSSHVFGDVKQFCERYDKPLVRLPAGYNPNQIAAQILQQVSERLGVEGRAV